MRSIDLTVRILFKNSKNRSEVLGSQQSTSEYNGTESVADFQSRLLEIMVEAAAGLELKFLPRNSDLQTCEMMGADEVPLNPSQKIIDLADKETNALILIANIYVDHRSFKALTPQPSIAPAPSVPLTTPVYQAPVPAPQPPVAPAASTPALRVIDVSATSTATPIIPVHQALAPTTPTAPPAPALAPEIARNIGLQLIVKCTDAGTPNVLFSQYNESFRISFDNQTKISAISDWYSILVFIASSLHPNPSLVPVSVTFTIPGRNDIDDNTLIKDLVGLHDTNLTFTVEILTRNKILQDAIDSQNLQAAAVPGPAPAVPRNYYKPLLYAALAATALACCYVAYRCLLGKASGAVMDPVISSISKTAIGHLTQSSNSLQIG